MITADQIGYECEIQENISVEELRKSYSNGVIIWLNASGASSDAKKGKYRCVLDYRGSIKYIEKNDLEVTANQAMILGAIDATKCVNKPVRLYLVAPTALGFATAFKGKGTNCSLIQQLYEEIKEKNCVLTEVQYLNGGDAMKKFIYSCNPDKSQHEAHHIMKSNMPEFTKDELRECYKFARDMIGNHNPDMIMEREDWEIFRDDFRGKLGEVALRKVIKKYISWAHINEEIDYHVYPRGEWDSNDLVVEGLHINVKSAKGKSRFLMVERERYNDDGTYAYDNHDGTPVRVDAYVFVNIDIKPEYNCLDFKHETLEEFMAYKNRSISYWVAGGISHDKFWQRKHFAPQGIKCDIQNLERVCKGEKPEIAPEGMDREHVLQRDNYILASRTELDNITQLFKRNENR